MYSRNPETEPSLRLWHQYACTKTVEIINSYGGNLRHGENNDLGLFEGFQILRDSDIAMKMWWMDVLKKIRKY